MVSAERLSELIEEQLDEPDDTALGFTVHTEFTIYLREGMKPCVALHTFNHELFHAMFTAAGRDKLSADEGFVDLMGMLLTQVQRTAR